MKIIFADVTIRNIDFKDIISNASINHETTVLTLSSRFNTTEPLHLAEDCGQWQTQINFFSNNFGLIVKYRLNLLNVMWLKRTKDDAFKNDRLTSLDVLNIINLELMPSKFKSTVNHPLIFIRQN